MGFLHKCVVRTKNDEDRKELIEFLETIGYVNGQPMIDGMDYTFITFFIGETACYEVWDDEYVEYFIKHGTIGFFDFGENVELFKAVTAMRNDTDKNQWFVHNSGEFIFCNQSELKHVLDNTEMYQEYAVAECHKATLPELVEKFKSSTLPNDISRCASKDCKLECRRKDQGTDYTSYSDLSFAMKNGKCEFQIKK